MPELSMNMSINLPGLPGLPELPGLPPLPFLSDTPQQPQNGCPGPQGEQWQPSDEAAGMPMEGNNGWGFNGGQGMLNFGQQPGANYGYNPGYGGGYPQEGFGQPLQMGQQPYGGGNQGGIIGELEHLLEALLQEIGMGGPQQSGQGQGYPQAGQNGCPAQQPQGPQNGCQAQQPQQPGEGCPPQPCQPPPPQQCCCAPPPCDNNNPVGRLGKIQTSGDPHNYDDNNGHQNIDPNSDGHWPTNAALFVNQDGSEVYETAGAGNSPVQNVSTGFGLQVQDPSQTTVYERNAQGQVVPLGTMQALGWQNGNNQGQAVGDGQTVTAGLTTVQNAGGGTINITG